MRAKLSLLAVIVLGPSLSGCVAYHVAATAVDVTTTVVGGAADVAGTVLTAPFGNKSGKSKDN